MARDGAPERKRGVEITNELPPVWKPTKSGEELNGYYRGWRDITYSGKTFKTYLIETEVPDGETGEIVDEIMSFSGAIADRLMVRVPRDKYVFITYKGKLKTARGKANEFSVQLEEGVEPLPENLGSS